MLLKIKNWERFQHYKDRDPPWIKLHFSMLSSADWVLMDDHARVLAIACMLIGSKKQGQIDGSEAGLAYLQRVAYLNKKPNLKPLIDCGFLECASDCEQMLANDTTETEKRHIKKEETEARFALPDWVPADLWDAWLKTRKGKNTVAAKNLNLRKLETLKAEGHEPKAVLEEAIARGWTGLFPPSKTQPRQSSQAAGVSWWQSDTLMMEKARELGIHTTGLTRDQLRGKINERMAA